MLGLEANKCLQGNVDSLERLYTPDEEHQRIVDRKPQAGPGRFPDPRSEDVVVYAGRGDAQTCRIHPVMVQELVCLARSRRDDAVRAGNYIVFCGDPQQALGRVIVATGGILHPAECVK
jgi:hypothetical protein